MTSSNALMCDIAFIDDKSHKRLDTFSQIANILRDNGIKVSPDFIENMEHTEKRQSSAIGSGVVLKHTRLKNLARPFSVLVKSQNSINFNSFDGQESHIMYFIFTPDTDGPLYLQHLARAARILKDPEIRAKIMGAEDGDAIKSIFLETPLHQFAA